jgi:hypothetical protein
MSAIVANRIRLALEHTKANFPEQQVDAFTSKTPRAPHGRIWDFEIGLFNKSVLDPLTGLQSITVEIKTATGGVIDAGSASLLSKTTGVFNAALTADQWANDQGVPSYHAKLTFTDLESGALDMAGSVENTKTFGFAVTALTPAGRITIGSGLLLVMKDGGTGAGSGIPPVATYTFSDQEIQGMLEGKLNTGENAAAVGFTLRDSGGSGFGIRFYVEMEGGIPVLRQSIIPPII